MKINKHLEKIKLNDIELKEKIALTIGVFDGLHRGHTLITDEVINHSLVNGTNSGILTFDMTFTKNLKNVSSFILSYDEKKKLISYKGFDFMYTLPFNDDIKNLSPEDFINLLTENFPISCICVGNNFAFGKNRIGTPEKLMEIGEKLGFEVRIISLEKDENIIISSSHIRDLLSEGNITLANKMLGYKYFITGLVIRGDNLASKLGFPTINIHYDKNKLIPKIGIYKGKVKIADRIHSAAIYVGKRPTVNGKEIRVEAHIIGFYDDLYGEQVEIVFEEFIRPEIKFNSLEDLKKQIIKDIELINEMEKNENRKQVITIDGTAGSGKTTIARFLAKKFNFDYIDSGALYRGIGYISKEKNLNNEMEIISYLTLNPIRFKWDGENFRIYYLDKELTHLIRSEDIGKLASFVGTMPKVREIVTKWQRDHISKTNRGLILEGRDSGTIVFPEAKLKIFVNANLFVRAQRRAKELKENNIEKIILALKERDKQDINRKIAPLRFPPKGYFIDNSNSALEDIYNKVLFLYMIAL